jgi:hypothetical protein
MLAVAVVQVTTTHPMEVCLMALLEALAVAVLLTPPALQTLAVAVVAVVVLLEVVVRLQVKTVAQA